MRFPGAVLALLLLLAGTADAATYQATFKGTQELTWKVDGVTTGCETRRGTGGGTMKFSIRTDEPGFLTSNGSKLKLLGSIVTTATGTLTGRFSDLPNTPCSDFPQDGPSVADASGCGARKFGIRIDAKPVGAFTYLTGHNAPLNVGSIAQNQDENCPYWMRLSLQSSSDLTACGDGAQQHRRSWGVAYSDGEGLFATRISAAQTKAIRKGAKRNLTGRTVVDCTIGSQYSGGIKLAGVLKYTLSLKRTS